MILVVRHGDSAEAVKFATRAVELAPQIATFNETLAQAYAAAGQGAKAIDAMHTAIRLEPGELKWQIRLAGLLVDAHQMDQAAAILRPLDPQSPRVQRLAAPDRARLISLQQVTGAIPTTAPAKG